MIETWMEKNNSNMKKIFLILAGITISLVSCKKDDKGGEEPAPKTDIQV